MRRGLVPVAVMLAALFLGALGAWAGEGMARGGEPVRTMAGILIDMNHFPGEADKAKLKAIVENDSASAHERTLAQAILGIEHTPSDAAKAKLQRIVEDESAPRDVRDLARAILGFQHKPGSDGKERLRRILGG